MTPETALVIIRFVHFGSVMLLLGGVVFRRHIAAPAISGALAATTRRWEFLAVLLAAATTLLWIYAETAIAADGWAAGADVENLLGLLEGTYFGHVWTVHLGLALLVLAATSFGWDTALEATAFGLAFNLGWVGHGVMLNGLAGTLLPLLLGLHVVAASLWVGALPGLILTQGGGEHFPQPAAKETLYRFSDLGRWLVLSTIAAGLLMVRGIFGDWPLGLGSSYLQLLALKITAVAGMVGLAVFNRYILMPRVGSALPVPPAITRTIRAEIVLAALVLALVAVFGNLPPMG